ncbi:MAG: hypothetical protein IPP48_10645 [Chitinophagaceae bacterium]|nr:hypothetical protein [Chitinophagaceae bacterium]
MSKIKNIIRTPSLLLGIYRKLSAQKRFLQQHIVPLFQLPNDGSLDESDFKKITHYYGLAVPAILGEAFCALHGKKMTEQERIASTNQGAMTGLFDDFFDKQNLSNDALKSFIENPITITGNASNEKLFLQLYNNALQNCPDNNGMLKQLYKVYDAQVESKKQAIAGLTAEEIKNITLKKGGESLLFYRTAFGTTLTKGEEIMLFKLGGLMQLANDIFDVYKDYKGGIHTLMTTTKKTDEVRQLFKQLLQEGYALAYKTGYPAQNVYRFLQIISIGIFSRCFVCLNHLEKAESVSDGIFTPSIYTRQQLICDMDKIGAVLRSVKYHIKYCRTY